MKVVGVGCGPGMLTGEAAAAIREAKIVAGSRRAIDLASAHISPGTHVEVITDYSGLSRFPDGTVILSTGDPMLAGLGRAGSEVIPGISSFQIATARLGIPQETCLVIDVHGKRMGPATETARLALGIGRTLFILADPVSDLRSFCRDLEDRFGDRHVAVLGDLGYPSESVLHGTVARPPEPVSRLYCVVIGTF